MRYLLLLCCLTALPWTLRAAGPLPPDDPRQSINYWRAHTLDPAVHADVALAQRVFARLLRAWDSSRVEPGLYVVSSEGGAWAASLADGNILLSRAAVALSLAGDRRRGEHLIAFVLAHELAHQRADDLWHQRFFRALGGAEGSHAELLDDLTLDRDLLRRIERFEAQADRDALVLMASVGFDPWKIVDQRDFFTHWVESLWGGTCERADQAGLRRACEQARTRALHAQLQLSTIASQVAVYDLGIEALVAGDHGRALHYFTLYGREFPGRAAMSAIGVARLGEAIDLRRRIDRLSGQPAWYFPLLLDAAPRRAADQASARRGVVDAEIAALTEKLRTRVAGAVEYLTRASRLDPDYRPLYLSIALAHLVEGNDHLLRGVLLGRYLPRFGDDAAARLLLALGSAQLGELESAELELAILAGAQQPASSALPADLLRYTASINLAEIYRATGRAALVPGVWEQLALVAQREDRGLLFQLALGRRGRLAAEVSPGLDSAPLIRGVRLGDRKPRDDAAHRIGELWIEGDLYHLYAYHDGARFVSGPDGRIISAAQVGGERALGPSLRVGDGAERPLQVLGLPDRRIQVGGGEFIAYDRFGLALRLQAERVEGWFLYTPPSGAASGDG